MVRCSLTPPHTLPTLLAMGRLPASDKALGGVFVQRGPRFGPGGGNDVDNGKPQKEDVDQHDDKRKSRW